MKQILFKAKRIHLRYMLTIVCAGLISVSILSFTVHKIADDFLVQLGISKTDADQKITNSILGGYFDQYGITKAKYIALGNRAALVKDVLQYVKQQVKSQAFINEYNTLKATQKPKPQQIQSPEELRKGLVDGYKKGITEMEVNIKKADASLKPVFEKVLEDAKKNLKDAEDPNNKMIANYKKEYPNMLKTNEEVYQSQLQEWETNYPANHLLFVKKRLDQFLKETEGIDFNAALESRNGKQYFVNKAYESKGNRWKMAFRAGREAVTTARAFVQEWINEIR